MPRALRLLIVPALLALAGCPLDAPRPAVVTPQVVTQTVTKYVPVPAKYTEPCPIEQPKLRIVAEAVRVAKARKSALEQCNRQLEQIRGLANQDIPGSTP